MEQYGCRSFMGKSGLSKLLLIVVAVSSVIFSMPVKAATADSGGQNSQVTLINSNQAIERAKQLNVLPQEKVKMKTTKLTEPEPSWEISYTYGELDDAGEQMLTGFIILSAETGELLSFYQKVKWDKGACVYPCLDSERTVELEEATETAIPFVEDLDLNLDVHWKHDDYPVSQYTRSREYPTHVIVFDRTYENIRYPSNYIIIRVSGWTGEIYEYAINWSKVKFEQPHDMISYTEAGRILFHAIEPSLSWSENPLDPELLKLVYSSNGFYILDAKGNFEHRYGSAPQPVVYPKVVKPEYPAEYAKHRLHSLYELELYYLDTEAGRAEPFYRMRIKPNVPWDYSEPYIDAENGEWVNFFHQPLSAPIPDASDWLIDPISSSNVDYKVAIILNHKLVKLANEPIIKNGFTLVPFRELFAQLDVSVSWDPAKWKVTASKNDTAIELTIGSDTVYINGRPQLLGTPAEIINGHTYVPARMILEAFGAKVDWNADSRLVLVQTEPSLPEPTALQLGRFRLHSQLYWEEN